MDTRIVPVVAALLQIDLDERRTLPESRRDVAATAPMNDDAIIDRPVTRLPPRTASRTVAQLAVSAAAHLVAVRNLLG